MVTVPYDPAIFPVRSTFLTIPLLSSVICGCLKVHEKLVGLFDTYRPTLNVLPIVGIRFIRFGVLDDQSGALIVGSGSGSGVTTWAAMLILKVVCLLPPLLVAVSVIVWLPERVERPDRIPLLSTIPVGSPVAVIVTGD